MAIFRPFAAIRPADGMADKIAALPYDVYNRKEAKEAVKNAPHSFLRIDRAETTLPDDVDIYDEKVYQKARELFEEQMSKGEFIQEKVPCFYLYELTMDGKTKTGVVGCAAVDDYCSGIIKKHENTRACKEMDRIRHVDTLNAQTGPIFLACRAREDLDEVIREGRREAPLYDFTTEDGITHRIFRISDETLQIRIQKIFQNIDSLYIADGHHRCASAVKVGLKRREEHLGYTGNEEFNYFLSVVFPDSELFIMDYNRVVKDLNGLSREEFICKLKDSFDVEEKGSEPVRPDKKGEIGLYLEGKGYLLSVKDTFKNSDPVKGLDVSLLQDLVLSPILGIHDPKTDKRIDFVGGIRGLKELKRRTETDMKAAFSMYPTSIQELFAVADAGKLMPPKSTWFEPKLRSGLLIHNLQ